MADLRPTVRPVWNPSLLKISVTIHTAGVGLESLGGSVSSPTHPREMAASVKPRLSIGEKIQLMGILLFVSESIFEIGGEGAANAGGWRKLEPRPVSRLCRTADEH